jgi:NitT/TauT family transport system substrate-binding protein
MAILLTVLLAERRIMLTRWMMVCVLAGGLICLDGCKKQTPAAAKDSASTLTPVKLVLNWKPEPEFGGLYAAQDLGIFKAHHLAVTITPGGPGVPTKQMVLSGQAPFGVLAADEVLTARAQGADLVGIYAIYQTNPQGIMAHADAGYKSLDQLLRSPVTLAVEPGLHYIDYLKKQVGSGFKASLVSYGWSIAPFLADPHYAQQCFITSEPIAARRQGAKVQVFLIAESGYNPYAGVVATTGDYLRAHPETVKALVESLREGWQAYLTDPAPANTTMGQLNNEMDAATFAAAAEAQKPLIANADTARLGLGHMTRDRWQTLARQLLELKVLKTLPDVDAAFTNPLAGTPSTASGRNER